MQYIAKEKAGFTEIVTSDDCVKQLYLDADADLTLLPSYILTARRYVEQRCNVPLVTKTVTVHLDTFPNYKDKIFLPLITESENVTTIAYIDSNDTSQTITLSDVIFANVPQPNYLIPKTEWPTGAKKVTITYEATAYYDKDSYKSLVLSMVAHQYANRDIVESKFENSLNNAMAPLIIRYNT